MPSVTGALALTALTVGTLHTLAGPDHYVPFVALARGGNWSLRRTLAVTALCGLGHVFSSVLLGFLGIGAGALLSQVHAFESVRGRVATWLLIGFGIAWAAWGLWHALRRRPHEHVHAHGDGVVHVHRHGHAEEHLHPHEGRAVWVLFIVFVLGPCEPLIPLVMVPAAMDDWAGVAAVTAIFGVATLASMLAVVTAGWHGVRALRLGALERYAHAMAGGVLALTGAAVLVFGL